MVCVCVWIGGVCVCVCVHACVCLLSVVGSKALVLHHIFWWINQSIHDCYCNFIECFLRHSTWKGPMHWHFPIFCLSQQNIVFLLKILSSGYSYISIGLHFPTECQEVSLSRVISLSFYPFFSLSFLSPSPSLPSHSASFSSLPLTLSLGLFQ